MPYFGGLWIKGSYITPPSFYLVRVLHDEK